MKGYNVKPIILTLDDEPQVLIAIERDLKRQYGKRFRIIGSGSGVKALELVQKLKAQNEVLALAIADQRMPGMTGVEFLQKVTGLFPDAKRVLLSNFADREAIMMSINKVRIDYYLDKPWDPPEVNLYPPLNDLLDDWWACFKPPFEGIKVIGPKWSPRSHEITDFLARNGIMFQAVDMEADSEARSLVSSLIGSDAAASAATGQTQALMHFPYVIFPDGSYLSEPTITEIAEKIGLKTRALMAFYDLIIIGAGPAGLAAAVYGASEGLHTLVIEREAPGGQASYSSNIENYLGFPSGLTGISLARRAVTQALKFGAEIFEPQQVEGIRTEGQYRMARLADGTEIRCNVMLIACGAPYRKLEGVKGIDRLSGAGVYYGASMVDALGYRKKDVYIVGGGNSAGQAAVHFAKYAKTVTLVVRDSSLLEKMSQYLVHQIEETGNIRILLNSIVSEVRGERTLHSFILTNTKTGEQRFFKASGLFIFIGADPNTNWLANSIKLDSHGFILTGSDLVQDSHKTTEAWPLERQPLLLETIIPGIFAAGDVRHGSVKRIAAGVGEGSTAIQLIHDYLRKGDAYSST